MTRCACGRNSIHAKFGKGVIRVASAGVGEKKREWQMRQELPTPRDTSCLADITVTRA
ncbi:MAG TPA: DUF4113 domain-containing protein [Accumulibacter sp.]|jgi:hypothetical protein|nr:DUF4113 domain-containing protein [Accumulibacter sp.]